MEAGKAEQRSVVRFLTAEGESTRNMHRRMKAVYGEHCLSLSRVKEWSKRFREGRSSVKDNPRPGYSNIVTSDAMVQSIDYLIRNNRRSTVDEIARVVGVSHGTVHNIITQQLSYRKVCAEWVPSNISTEKNQGEVKENQTFIKQEPADGKGVSDEIDNHPSPELADIHVNQVFIKQENYTASDESSDYETPIQDKKIFGEPAVYNEGQQVDESMVVEPPICNWSTARDALQDKVGIKEVVDEDVVGEVSCDVHIKDEAYEDISGEEDSEEQSKQQLNINNSQSSYVEEGDKSYLGELDLPNKESSSVNEEKTIITKKCHKETRSSFGQRSMEEPILRLEGRHFPALLPERKRRRCRVCNVKNKRKESRFRCEKCDAGLCVSPCFKLYHTQKKY